MSFEEFKKQLEMNGQKIVSKKEYDEVEHFQTLLQAGYTAVLDEVLKGLKEDSATVERLKKRIEELKQERTKDEPSGCAKYHLDENAYCDCDYCIYIHDFQKILGGTA